MPTVFVSEAYMHLVTTKRGRKSPIHVHGANRKLPVFVAVNALRNRYRSLRLAFSKCEYDFRVHLRLDQFPNGRSRARRARRWYVPSGLGLTWFPSDLE